MYETSNATARWSKIPLSIRFLADNRIFLIVLEQNLSVRPFTNKEGETIVLEGRKGSPLGDGNDGTDTIVTVSTYKLL